MNKKKSTLNKKNNKKMTKMTKNSIRKREFSPEDGFGRSSKTSYNKTNNRRYDNRRDRNRRYDNKRRNNKHNNPCYPYNSYNNNRHKMNDDHPNIPALAPLQSPKHSNSHTKHSTQKHSNSKKKASHRGFYGKLGKIGK
eukprot:129783_1